jgi:hypothetical protein
MFHPAINLLTFPQNLFLPHVANLFIFELQTYLLMKHTIKAQGGPRWVEKQYKERD